MPNRKGAVCLSGFLTDYTNYILQKKWVDVTFQKKPREKQDSGKHQRYGKLDMLFIFLFAICRRPASPFVIPHFIIPENQSRDIRQPLRKKEP